MARENRYGYQAVKGFAISSLFCGTVGSSICSLISPQPFYPRFNFTSWLTYGRPRLLHTNSLIRGFAMPAAFNLFFSWYSVAAEHCLHSLVSRGSRSESC